MIKHFRPTSCWKNIFYRLAASLSFALKWFPMVDRDQIFSPNILPYEKMFDRLATLVNKA